MTLQRVALTLCAVLVVGAVAGVVFGRTSQNARHVNDEDPVESAGTFSPEDALNGFEERGYERVDNPSATLATAGIELGLPTDSVAGNVTGTYVDGLEDPGEPDVVVLEYDNGMTISFEEASTRSAAAQVVDGMYLPEFSSVMHRVSVEGNPGVAWSKGAIPAETDGEGWTKSGTGIELGKSQLAFASDRWLVFIVHPDLPYGQLQKVAASMILR